MAIPTVKVLLLPTLKCHEDGESLTRSELIARVANRMELSDEDTQEMNTSKSQRKIYDRVTMAVVSLRNAQLVETVKRGVTQITERGRELLAENPTELSVKFLKARYPEYSTFGKKGSVARKRQISQYKTPAYGGSGSPASGEASQTEGVSDPTAQNLWTSGATPAAGGQAADQAESASPVESRKPVVRRLASRTSHSQLERTLANSIKALHDGLESTIAQRVSSLGPERLSRIVLALLAKMGFGSADQTRESSDSLTEGATIKDALGLNQVYARVATGAKADVSDLQDFSGAFDAAHAERGIFVSIGGFTSEARGYALGSAKRIKILDSAELARLLVAHEVGIVVHARHTVKRVDPSYFARLHESAS